IPILPILRITGALLSNMTQKLAYKAIRINKMRKQKRRRRTKENLEYAKAAAEEAFNDRPTEERFWKSLKHKDIPRKTRYTLWMMAHDAYMVGENWKRPNYAPELQEQAMCKHCPGNVESIEHILTTCQCPGQKEIWELAKEILTKKGIEWRAPTLGLLLTSGMPTFKGTTGKRDIGKERLYRIIIALSIQTIWNVRCDRVIDGLNAPFSPDRIAARWTRAVNDSLEMDCLLTRRKFGKRALDSQLVERTWGGTLQNETQLPRHWTEVSGVLVGIGPSRIR
ncbi:hypothetical protein EV421DRAFT_1714212, partial [Armillaria borealis]